MSIESRSRQYGKVFDHWQIKEFLGSGSGGKSAVFRLTRSDSTRGTSALKVINLMEERGSFEELSSFRKSEYLAACEDCSNKAEQEVWLMDDLQGNTNIVDYLDHTFVDWSDEFGFGRDMLIRMELLKDLRGVIQKGHVFSEAEVLKVGKDICTALVLCHRKDILHRDIKPENIFVNKDGNFKLGDFGVSRILSSAPMAMASTGIGTPEYAAPEQFTGHHDKRVDIYSLGLVLYELGNRNRLPFAESTYARQEDIRRRHMGEPLPAPCNVGDDFAKVILKACANRAEDRYQTAGEFLKALNRIANRLASERAVAPKREYAKPATKIEPVFSGFETQKAVYDEYLTAPAKPEQEEPAFDWDTYSTMMAKAEEPTEFAAQPEGNTYQPARRAETNPQPKRRKNQTLNVALIVGVTLLLMFVTGILLAYITGAAPEKENNETQAEVQTAESTAAETEAPTAETRETMMEALLEETKPTGMERIEKITLTQDQQQYQSVAVGGAHIVALKSDGTVVASGINKNNEQNGDGFQFYGQSDVESWRNVVSVSAWGRGTLGLKSDGTVVAAGDNGYGQNDTTGWTDIVAIATGGFHAVGLRSDGTVVAVGNNEDRQCDVSEWDHIVAISANSKHTVGLKDNGTVVATGDNSYGQCNVDNWTDIEKIATFFNFTVGLKTDGTVVAVGNNEANQCNVEGWKDIVAIGTGYGFTVGLKSDGTVVATGENKYGECDVSSWRNISALSVGPKYTVGLKSDGTVVATGYRGDPMIESAGSTRCDVGNWRDIVAIFAGAANTVGLMADGTVVATGANEFGQCNVESWNNIRISNYVENDLTTHSEVEIVQQGGQAGFFGQTATIVGTDEVNVRISSSTSTKIIGTLPYGTVANILQVSEDGKWYNLDVDVDQNPQTGSWVYHEYIKVE